MEVEGGGWRFPPLDPATTHTQEKREITRMLDDPLILFCAEAWSHASFHVSRYPYYEGRKLSSGWIQYNVGKVPVGIIWISALCNPEVANRARYREFSSLLKRELVEKNTCCSCLMPVIPRCQMPDARWFLNRGSRTGVDHAGVKSQAFKHGSVLLTQTQTLGRYTQSPARQVNRACL